MPRAPDPKTLAAALSRFRAFFDELRGTSMERDDVLTQVALGLLSPEHVLMTGPPGTGKSALASAVIGRIPDERTGRPSVFARRSRTPWTRCNGRPRGPRPQPSPRMPRRAQTHSATPYGSSA